jgi:hypothetical protein
MPFAVLVLQVLAVLPLVLQHWQPARFDKSDATKLLCTLLQVSQSFNSALQQHGCRCSVSLSKPSSKQITSFAAWLQQYGSFLHSFTADDIAVYRRRTRLNPVAEEDSVADIVLEHMFSMGLKLYCAGTTTSTAAHHSAQTAVAAGDGQLAMPARRQMPLGLVSLAWVSMQTPAVLQALQAAPSLTELKLTNVSTAHVTPAMLAALGGLTGLRSLTFDCDGSQVWPQQFMHVVGGMQQLACLCVSCFEQEPCSLLQLPASLCALTFLVESQAGAAVDGQQQQEQPSFALSFALSFAHLTNLLECTVGVMAEGSVAALRQLVLPPNLTSLNTGNHVDVLELPVSISEMHLFNGQQCPSLVQKLPALQNLSKLVLYFNDRPAVPGT